MITMREDDSGGGDGTGTFFGATGVRMEEREEVSTPETPEAAVEVVDARSNELEIHGTAAAVRQWIDHAGRFERAKTACQVMAGFELAALKRSMGFVQGGRRDQNPNDSGFASWEEFCRERIGISDDTARGWMRMAEAVKPRLRKLPGIGHLIREIIDLPLAQLPPEKCRLLADAVHKLADGRTQLDFMLELGLVKRPQGAAASGGNLGGGRSSGGTPSEEALRQIARDDWTAVGQKLRLAAGSFVLLDDPELDGLISALETTLSAMRRWRCTPHAARTASVILEVRDYAKV